MWVQDIRSVKLAVDFPAMPDRNQVDQRLVNVERINDSIIAHSETIRVRANASILGKSVQAGSYISSSQSRILRTSSGASFCISSSISSTLLMLQISKDSTCASSLLALCDAARATSFTASGRLRHDSGLPRPARCRQPVRPDLTSDRFSLRRLRVVCRQPEVQR